MSAPRIKTEARYCAFCAQGNHVLCTGGAGATGPGELCACGERGHDPTVEIAAAMREYAAPDRAFAGVAVEQLATEYRQGIR